MKLLGTAFLAIVIWAALTALAALFFSAALGQFAGTSLPHLSWWQSFCFLFCVAAVGASFGYAGAASKASR